MEKFRPEITLAFVIGYMILCVGIGVWAMRRTHSTRDFFMASRHLGFLVASVAIFSSIMSGFGFVGGPGLVYKMGASSFWILCATIAGIALAFFLLAKRLRVIAAVRDPISLPDAIGARYKSRSASFLAAIAILLGVLGYLATQILAMAWVLKNILADVESIGDVPLGFCLALSSAVLVFYCVTGGIIASVYTDLFQGLIMVVAALLVFFTAIATFEGGLTEMAETMLVDDPESIGPWGTRGMVCCLSWYFLLAVGMCGQPHVITKFMMTRSVKDARSMLPVSVLGYALSALLWVGIGLCMRAVVLEGSHDSLSNADEAAPAFLQRYAHPLLSGIVFAGLLSAIMSTADGFLNIGAAAVVHDIPRAIRGKSLKNELLWARLATVVLATIAALFALYSGEMIALLGVVGFSTFAAAIVPTVAIGFNWKRATALACNLAILSAIGVNFGLRLLSIRLPYEFDGGAFSLLVSITVFFFVSLCSKPRKIDPDIEAAMDL